MNYQQPAGMLNISDNNIQIKADLQNLKSPERNIFSPWHLSMRNLLLTLMAVLLVFMFLPWTQNVHADGKVTTLRPEQRPQTIHSTIAGRIEHWYVVEGQRVNKGDTILYLSEVKSEYFDPQLVDRVGNQVKAKEGAISSYSEKVGALENQMLAMRQELDNKTAQIRNKIEQARLKVQNDSLKVVQANNDLQIAQRQFAGTENLYKKGLKSLTDFEEKKLKLRETETKLQSAQNQLESTKNDLKIYRADLALAQNEFANKIAKTQSDKFSTLSDQFEATASVNKLRVERENYTRRRTFYYILAPQDGYIVQAIKPGIGETIKEGDPVVSIQPADYQLAVEMYVKPLDLPLLQTGQHVRFTFDGWPSFFFSGWPGASLGTFGGNIVAIDRNISSNGKFRVLVAPAQEAHTWPAALQVGGGAKGIALLNNVPVWYELWRVLNGFPPDFYQDINPAPAGKKGDSYDKAKSDK